MSARLLRVFVALVVVACQRAEPEHPPDAVLQRELGLTSDDEVHTVRITGGEVEIALPALDSIPVGAYVEFVSGDWLVHEVRFDAESSSPEVRAFLEQTDQMASPPLLYRDSRFVVSFAGAPPGHYPYLLEGNARPGRGALVVVRPTGR